MIITIDGPAGSGKSTIAKTLAEKLGYKFLDTGAMYRVVALAAQRAELVRLPNDQEKIGRLAATIEIGFEGTGSQLRVFLGTEDVSGLIRTEGVSSFASQISAIPAVRAAMVEKQRQLGKRYGNVVTEGRDQGSVVFPDAGLKLYLDADVQERAKRRYEQLVQQGHPAEFEKILSALKERDFRDKTREASPLVIPQGAVVIDTTPLTADGVMKRIIELVRERSLDA